MEDSDEGEDPSRDRKPKVPGNVSSAFSADLEAVQAWRRSLLEESSCLPQPSLENLSAILRCGTYGLAGIGSELELEPAQPFDKIVSVMEVIKTYC